MIANRRVGDRLKIETEAVGRMGVQTHFLLESDIQKAWSTIIKISDPRFTNPHIRAAKVGWTVYSSLTGEVLGHVKIVPPAKGRPRP